MSRRHLSLELAGGTVRLRDLDSTNGTFVQGVRVVEAFLMGGERVEAGDSAFVVHRKSATAAQPPERASFGSVIGASPAMRRLYPLLDRLAVSTVPLVIEGETGTGKEMIAEAVHEVGPRSAQPFVVFDCTTAAPTLLEAELFGHDKGAFTGAVQQRKGVFEHAHGGTLLIDEIGDLDIALQAKLLRAIERQEIRPVGRSRPITVDVRVLAATRRNLDHEVQEGRFRDDLFHRLAVGRIELPPLRRRREDIPILVRHFWLELGGAGMAIPNDLMRRWCDDPWPGNVRELRNAVARHLAVGQIDAAHEPSDEANAVLDFIAAVIGEQLPLPVARLKVVKEFERRYIDDVLSRHDGNVAAAAKASGIARRYFQILRRGERR